MKRLLTFVGNNDGHPFERPGAILSILRQRTFHRVCLFYNHEKYLKSMADISRYCEAEFPDLEISYQKALAENPTDYNTVYPAMYQAVKQVLRQNRCADDTISLTSGTPTMHACWIFLQQGRVIDAELIQVSRQGEISEICFDLDDFPKIQQVHEIKAEMTRLARENQSLKSRLNPPYDPIIGESPGILKVREQIHMFSDKNIPIFIRGQSGTGKELVADAIHFNSPRKEKRLIRVNCGAISPELFESEFFGHKKGAFTGAISDKPGHFKLADGGTLFLDEIADLPQFMQVKLLRVLKDGSFTPVGDVKEGRSDVRIISATNKDLRKQVQDGSFREDLFYRIVRMEITLPPLRDRGNDIVRIAQHIVAQLNQKYGQRKVLDQSAADMIMKHHWPGNVRELKSALETAFVLAEDRIRAENLNIIDLRPETRDILIPDEGIDLGNEVLPRYYEAALKKTGGNRAQAARLLGMAPHTFRARLKKLGK